MPEPKRLVVKSRYRRLACSGQLSEVSFADTGASGKGLVGVGLVKGELGLEDRVVQLLVGALVDSCSGVVYPSPATDNEMVYVLTGIGVLKSCGAGRGRR